MALPGRAAFDMVVRAKLALQGRRSHQDGMEDAPAFWEWRHPWYHLTPYAIRLIHVVSLLRHTQEVVLCLLRQIHIDLDLLGLEGYSGLRTNMMLFSRAKRKFRIRWLGWKALAILVVVFGMAIVPLPSWGQIFGSSAVPVVLNGNAGGSIELGMKFTADQAGTISAIRFYKSFSDSTTQHVANLWSTTGTLLASATSTSETASGWQQVNLASAVPIAANTVYVVSYHTPGSYAATYGYFNTAVDNPPLYAVVNSASNPNGVFLYGASSAFPVNNGYGANYWVDIVFTPSTSTASLVSLQVSPVNPSIAMGSTQQFLAIGTFSDSSTQDLTTQVSWSSGGPSVATIASGGLASSIGQGSSLITATAHGGISGTATLTVTNAPSTTYTLFSSSAVPAVLSANAGGSIELGMKFTADWSGAISGIRFYKGAGSTGPHVGNLWDSSGNLLASVPFANETASGWQQANLASPVAIAAKTVYLVSYHTPGSYSANYAYFNVPVDNAPLHAVVNSATNPNGVYIYGASSAFPIDNAAGANYWVDVVFSDVPGVPASITATAGSGQSAAINTTFATTLQGTVRDADGNPVSGAVVTFTAPAGGSGGTFAGGVNTATVMTDSYGIATAPTFTASGIAGNYAVAATVAGVPTPASFSLTNLGAGTAPPAPSPLSIITTSLSNGVIGVPYSASLQASGGTPPYSWTLINGTTLLPGLQLNASTGTITGTPTAAGTTSFTVQVTDSSVPTPQSITFNSSSAPPRVQAASVEESAVSSTSIAFPASNTPAI